MKDIIEIPQDADQALIVLRYNSTNVCAVVKGKPWPVEILSMLFGSFAQVFIQAEEAIKNGTLPKDMVIEGLRDLFRDQDVTLEDVRAHLAMAAKIHDTLRTLEGDAREDKE